MKKDKTLKSNKKNEKTDINKANEKESNGT